MSELVIDINNRRSIQQSISHMKYQCKDDKKFKEQGEINLAISAKERGNKSNNEYTGSKKNP
jgi:hypothetical protein